MQIKTTMISARMAIIKKTRDKSAGENLEKREPSYTVGRNVNWYSQYGNSMDVSE